MKHNLHFVGSFLYTIDSFEKEAAKHGVQRSVNFHSLKKLEFQDEILLARFINPNENKKIRDGQAEVFGYFTINGLSHNLPTEINQKLCETLNVTATETPSNALTVRACGTYTVGSVLTVENSLQDILKKIEATLKDENLSPQSFKWFLTGAYTKLSTFILQPIKFKRGIFSIDIDGLNLKRQETEPNSLIWIRNYKQRTYMTKTQREQYETSVSMKSLEEFFK